MALTLPPLPAAVRAHPLFGDARAAVVTCALLVLTGAPIGLLWGLLAPRVRLDTGAVGGDVDLERLFVGSREGTFVLLSLAVGALAGALAWTLARRWGPGVVLGLAAGGLLAGGVAVHTGETASDRSFRAAVDAGATTEPVRARVELASAAPAAALPLAALVVFAGLVGLQRPARPAQEPLAGWGAPAGGSRGDLSSG